MKTDEPRPACDEKMNQLRRELLERIVRNEARRRTEQNVTVRCAATAWETPTAIGGHNG